MIDQEVTAAARQAVAKMRRNWAAYRWGEPGDAESAARDYGQALLEVGDAEAITTGVERAIRAEGGRFPPSIADVLAYVRAAMPPPAPLEIPAGAHRNRCPICAKEPPGIRDSRKVVVDERTGIASCTEGLHGYTWFVTADRRSAT